MPASLDSGLVKGGFVRFQRIGAPKSRSEIRGVFLSRNVQPWLDSKKSEINTAALAGITARLNYFVEGNRLTVSTPELGNGKGDVTGLRGYNDRLFELRFFDVAPQHRMLGVFPQKDIFVGLMMAERSKLDGKWNEYCSRALNGFSTALGNSTPVCLEHKRLDDVLSNWTVSI